MADPVIANIPGSVPADQARFFQSLKSSVEFLMGHGRNSDSTRALRVGELEKLGWDYNAFLNSSASSPYPITTSGGSTSQDAPPAPSNLAVSKGAFVHTLTWDNPADPDKLVSHVEVWVAINSQSRDEALLVAIVTVTDSLRGQQGMYKHAGFDVTADLTYWIRSSTGFAYSPWCPPDVQGGYVVPGDESVGETADKIIDALNGATPPLYDAGTDYEKGGLCRTLDGRRWRSIYEGVHSGNEPPDPTYWERFGILMQGDVDGRPMVGVDGWLVVDDTILARHIQAGSIIASHLAANQILVGHTIKSSNYTAGYQGWMIDGVAGTAEFNNMSMTFTWNDIQNKPTSLSGINSSEGSKLSGIATGATRNTGALANLNTVTDTYVTSITGPKIRTGKIYSNGNGYWDLDTSCMWLPYRTSGVAAYIAFGGSHAENGGKVWGLGGSIGLSAKSGHPVSFNVGIYHLRYQWDSGVDMNGTGSGYTLRPDSNYTSSYKTCLGTYNKRFWWVYAGAYSAANPAYYYDSMDDLAALHAIRPDENGRIKKSTLPDQVLDLEVAKTQIQKDNGNLLSESEIDAAIRDDSDMGAFVGVNMNEMLFFVEGAVRQLDRENSATQYELLNWLANLDKRVKTLEAA